MPRIPYLPEATSEPADIVSAMRARRGGRINEADRIILHAPEFARGFNILMGDVRGSLSLPDDLRELAIIAVGVLNASDYEVEKHMPVYLQGGGTAEKLDALKDIEAASRNAQLFNAAERTILRLTLEMTRDVIVCEETFQAARELFPGTRQLVEMIGVIASYNMASRILVAFQVEP
jgi:alkylhydroperoxidase family enzyme